MASQNPPLQAKGLRTCAWLLGAGFVRQFPNFPTSHWFITSHSDDVQIPQCELSRSSTSFKRRRNDSQTVSAFATSSHWTTHNLARLPRKVETESWSWIMWLIHITGGSYSDSMLCERFSQDSVHPRQMVLCFFWWNVSPPPSFFKVWPEWYAVAHNRGLERGGEGG